MRQGKCVLISTLCLASLAMVIGCPAGGGIVLPPVPVDIPLGESLGQFSVTAGEPAQQAGTTSFDTGGISVAAATLELDPSTISIAPAESAKTRLAQTGSNTAVVTVRIASADAVSTVCEAGEQYGPYTVTFDDNFVVQSISPSTVTLSQNTIDLLNAGSFSLCIQVEMSIDGTITIEELRLNISARIGG